MKKRNSNQSIADMLFDILNFMIDYQGLIKQNGPPCVYMHSYVIDWIEINNHLKNSGANDKIINNIYILSQQKQLLLECRTQSQQQKMKRIMS